MSHLGADSPLCEQRLSKLIFKALRRSGLAAIISKGWGQLGVIEACAAT